MLLLKLTKLLALDHLEAGISTEDFVEGVRGALLSERVLTLQESLLLAWVENDQAWKFAFLKVEYRGEIFLSADVEAHEVKCDAALDLARESIVDVLEGLDDGGVGRRGVWQSVDHTKHAIFLKADVVSTFLAEVGN